MRSLEGRCIGNRDGCRYLSQQDSNKQEHAVKVHLERMPNGYSSFHATNFLSISHSSYIHHRKPTIICNNICLTLLDLEHFEILFSIFLNPVHRHMEVSNFPAFLFQPLCSETPTQMKLNNKNILLLETSMIKAVSFCRFTANVGAALNQNAKPVIPSLTLRSSQAQHLIITPHTWGKRVRSW